MICGFSNSLSATGLGKEGIVTDIVLRDIDPVLAERIKRISDARGWSMHDTLLRLLEHGLHVCEGDGAVHLEDSEADILEEALAAMEQVPNDSGFSLIGRAKAPAPLVEEEPDQSIAGRFELE